MSMLSSQCERLRRLAGIARGYAETDARENGRALLFESAEAMREAADTITILSDKLQGVMGTRYCELFGTPERAAQTVMRYLFDGCDGVECADGCPFYDVRYLTNCFLASNTSAHELRVWLEGDAE